MNSYIIKSIDGPEEKDNAFKSKKENKVQALGYSQSRENVEQSNSNVLNEDIILYKVNVKIDQFKSCKIVVHKGDSL